MASRVLNCLIDGLRYPKFRKWGFYATLIRTPWFCVKLLRFDANGELSYQMHQHRTEIWVFLRGKGKITYRLHNEPPQYRCFGWVNGWLEVWKIEPQGWHCFRAFSKPVYALEFQYGPKVTETDIERAE